MEMAYFLPLTLRQAALAEDQKRLSKRLFMPSAPTAACTSHGRGKEQKWKFKKGEQKCVSGILAK